jgi:hypothetical protein
MTTEPYLDLFSQTWSAAILPWTRRAARLAHIQQDVFRTWAVGHITERQALILCAEALECQTGTRPAWPLTDTDAFRHPPADPRRSPDTLSQE